MHELSLYGQVPVGRHDQVLNILAGVAAMQPRRTLERHVLYVPLREPEEPGTNLGRGASQTITIKQQAKPKAPPSLYYTKLVQRLSEDDFGTGDGLPHDSGRTLSAEVESGEEPVWSTVFEDWPDTGDRGVSVRFTRSTDLTSGNPHKYMVAAGPNRFVNEYYVEGHQFVHGNLVILLYRVLHEPGVSSVQEAPKVNLPPFAGLDLLDPSGAYIIHAKVRVQEFQNAKVMEGGVNELKSFQTQMKGCVGLFLPDRLQLDTRVKYKPPHLRAPPLGRKG